MSNTVIVNNPSDYPSLFKQVESLNSYWWLVEGQFILAYHLDDASVSACKQAMATAKASIDSLGPEGKMGMRLLDGSLSKEQWANSANETGKLIAEVEDKASTLSWIKRGWDEIVIQSVVDAKKDGKDLLDKLPSTEDTFSVFKWAVVGFVAFVILKITGLFR